MRFLGGGRGRVPWIVGRELKLGHGLRIDAGFLRGVGRAKAGLAQLSQDVLHPCAVLVLPVPGRVEQPDDGLADPPELGGGDEVVQGDRGLGRRRQTPGGVDLEPPLAVADLRHEAEVVDGPEGAVVVAAAEGDLELARERARERMAQEMAGDGLGIGGDVERRAVADLGELAGGDGAHGVAARLARRESDLVETAHDRLHLDHLHEVQLDVLPRRHVPEAARVPSATSAMARSWSGPRRPMGILMRNICTSG